MKIVNKLFLVFIFLLLFILCICTPEINKYKNNGSLIINEVMPSNHNTIMDEEGNYYDYIEIYNGYDYDVNLKGYYLSDDDINTKKWKFDDVTIKSHDYLVVYASGLNKVINGNIHTNFKLTKKGEVITLSKPDGKFISKVKYGNTMSDTSYGYNGKKYVYYYVGTPNKKNTGLTSKEPITVSDNNTKLYINEYIVKSSAYSNVVELYNDEDKDINLKDYILRVNGDEYVFKDVSIKSKDFLVLYFGCDDEEKLCIDIEFGERDNLALLDSHRGIISSITIKNAELDNSIGLYNGTYEYYEKPTIGKDNDDSYIKDNDSTKDIIINEVSAVGSEWIELKNITNEDINLSKYSIADNSGKLVKLPDTIIKANGFYVLYGSDNYYYDGILYAGFHINNANEVVRLYKNGNLIDTFNVGKLSSGLTRGISDDKEVIYSEPTKGYENSNNYYLGYSDEVVYSQNGGYVDDGFKLELSTNDESKIYYTLDGSFPSTNSILYSEPITITKTTVVKAISYKENYVTSPIVSRTFIVGRKHDIAYISISSNYDNLFGNTSGILVSGYYNNFKQDWERIINFEFYEPDGTLGVSFAAGTKLVGQDSREEPQKSMAIILREVYGTSSVTYPFFKDSDVVTFKSFVLRNSGEDPNRIKIKDTFLANVLKGQMDIDMQEYRPVAVYINGQYYGLYNLREKINDNYIVSNYGVEKNSIDLIKGDYIAQAGSINSYDDLYYYIRTHDTRNDEVYKYLETQIDMQELANYWVARTYYGETDTGNIRCWKTTDGKWRWILYDQDWSLYPSLYRYVDLYYPFEPYGHGVGNYFSTMITYKLWQNWNFRDLYLKTFAYHLKNTFNPDRMIAILDEQIKEVENEMPYHIDRWYSDYVSSGKTPIRSMDSWRTNLDTLKTIIRVRYDLVKNNLKSEFRLSDYEYNLYFGDL